MVIALRIRTTDGADFELKVDESSSVQELLEQVNSRLQFDCNQKYVRLIFSGRLLQPPSALLGDFKVSDGSFIHAVISNRAAIPPEQAATVQDSDSDSADERNAGSTRLLMDADMANLRGLDVLMRPLAGRNNLDRDEVLSLRSYFREDIQEFAERRSLHRQEDESEQEYEYRIETAWMAAQGPRSEFQLNLRARSLFNRRGDSVLFAGIIDQMDSLRASENSPSGVDFTGGASVTEMGTFRDFLYGILMGFALRFMMIFCIWDRNVSHRQKLGILCGIMLQMIVSLAQRDALQMAASTSDAGAVKGDHEEFETTIGIDRNGHRASLQHLDEVPANASGSSQNGIMNADNASSEAIHAAVVARYLRGSDRLAEHFSESYFTVYFWDGIRKALSYFSADSTAAGAGYHND